MSAGCSSDGHADPSATTSSTLESVAEPVLEVADQATDGSTLVLDEVGFPHGGGFVVIREGGAAPGPVLAASTHLDAGLRTDARIDFPGADLGTSSVWVMLHADDDGNGEFGFPDSDQPFMRDDGTLFVAQIDLEREDT